MESSVMRGREFAVIAEKLKQSKPDGKESMSAWMQYNECVEKVADALQSLFPVEFRRQQFYYKCLNEKEPGDTYAEVQARNIFTH